jgi:mRNA-degrading endonuclease toxin of MazEF toxin-antitoxin module
VIRSGDIVPRQDTNSELFVVVLSNSIHLQAHTGRVVTCPYIPGQVADTDMPLVVGSQNEPRGTLLAELVQWLPVTALADPVGNVGEDALRRTSAIISALISL